MYIRKDVKPFEKKVWLSSPTMHGEELKWMIDAYNKNWMTTAGENGNQIERLKAIGFVRNEKTDTETIEPPTRETQNKGLARG